MKRFTNFFTGGKTNAYGSTLRALCLFFFSGGVKTCCVSA